MKMRYIGLIILAGLFSLAGCKDSLEDYYGDKDEPGLSSVKIRTQLKDARVYSKFLKLLEETGLDREFDKDLLYTVWAPIDETMPDTVERMSPEQKKKLIQNHISYTVVYRRNLEKLSRVKTLAGKYLTVAKGENGFSVDGAGLVNVDQVCLNGVIHGVKEWLLPRPSLYEWLERLDDSYSIFKEALLSLNNRAFDKEHSIPADVNEMGQIVYDTVWKTTNPIFDKGDIRLEEQTFTFFVPDNETIEEMYTATTEYLNRVKYPCSQEDTAMWMDWLLKASIHKSILDVEAGKYLYSVFNKDFRTDYQQVEEPIDLSNGRAYRLIHCHIPRNLYFKTLNFNPYVNRRYAPGEFDSFTGLPSFTLDSNGEVVRIQFGIGGGNFSFQSYWFDLEEGFHPVQVMPGNYKLTGRFDSWEVDSKSDSVKIWINDQEIATINGITQKLYHAKQGLIAEEINIGDTLGPITVKLGMLLPKGSVTFLNTKMGPGRFMLTPTDNY